MPQHYACNPDAIVESDKSGLYLYYLSACAFSELSCFFCPQSSGQSAANKGRNSQGMEVLCQLSAVPSGIIVGPRTVIPSGEELR